MANEKTQTPASLGYPNVENLIDTENFDEINSSFESAYSELDSLSRKTKGFKKTKDAKKAMMALELTMELLRELLTIKYQMQEAAKSSPPSK